MKRFLRMTKEAAFGVYDAAGDACYPRLSSSGAFGPMEKPEFWTIMDGSGLGVQALSGTQTMVVSGQLVTEIGPTLAEFLMPWACTRIDDAQAVPWTTTELPRDLVSLTSDYGRSVFDASTAIRTRYLGNKCSTLSLTCSRDQPKLMGTFGILGGSVHPNHFDPATGPDETEFPEQDCADAPQDCYLFQQLKGNITIMGAARTNFDSFSMQLTNNLKPYFDESHFANAIRIGGRTLTVTTRMRLKATPDDWAAYKQGTTGTASFKWTSGANSLEIRMGALCYINQIAEEAPIDEEHYYSLTLVNQLDPATCTDFEVLIV